MRRTALSSGRALLSTGTFYLSSLTDPSTFPGAVAVGVVLLIIGGVGTWLVKSWRREEPPPPTAAPTPPPLAPDLQILDVQSTGGGRSLTFRVEISNVGSRFSRCNVTAYVGDQQVECNPSNVNLVPQDAPERVTVSVPRPDLGDLVPEFANEPTLYNRTLRVEVADGEHRTSCEWHEKVYSLEENAERYHIQQRVWRRGRGEETENDRRSAALDAAMRRYREKHT